LWFEESILYRPHAGLKAAARVKQRHQFRRDSTRGTYRDAQSAGNDLIGIADGEQLEHSFLLAVELTSLAPWPLIAERRRILPDTVKVNAM
jgi:hypothetical protein